MIFTIFSTNPQLTFNVTVRQHSIGCIGLILYCFYAHFIFNSGLLKTIQFAAVRDDVWENILAPIFSEYMPLML